MRLLIQSLACKQDILFSLPLKPPRCHGAEFRSKTGVCEALLEGFDTCHRFLKCFNGLHVQHGIVHRLQTFLISFNKTRRNLFDLLCDDTKLLMGFVSGFFFEVIVNNFDVFDVIPLIRSRDDVLLQSDVGDTCVGVVSICYVSVCENIKRVCSSCCDAASGVIASNKCKTCTC